MDIDEGSPLYFQSTLLSALRSERRRKRLKKAGHSIAESDLSKFASDPDLEDLSDENLDDYSTPSVPDSETLSVNQSQHDCLMVVTDGGEVDCNTTEVEHTKEDQNEKFEDSGEKKRKKLKQTEIDSITFESDSSEFSPFPVSEDDENQHFSEDHSPVLFESEHVGLRGFENEILEEASDGEKDHCTETGIESNENKNLETPHREEMVKNEAKRLRKTKPDRESDNLGTKISKKEKSRILTEFRAESQRLLRERGTANFKPARMVQKSVSCVLDKIRKRKRDISTASKDTEIDEAAESDIQREETEMKNHNATIDMKTENGPSIDNKDSNNEISDIHKEDSDSPKDVQYHSKDYDSPNRSDTEVEEAILAPSAIVNNLKIITSVEKQSNDIVGGVKDNATAKQLSPAAQCFAKEFFDDEAEEEPDSDDDKPQSDDDEEDESNGLDEFNDLIATDFEEDPDDKDNLDELHQKWLEQQDAAGTEKLLHKIGRNNAKRELSPCQNEEDSESDECNVENNPIPFSNARLNLKKAKEMFHLLYTDTKDVYVSSDEEDQATAELELFRERSALEMPTMVEENLRIKKINVVENKKRQKNNISTETMNFNARKISFLGREAKSTSSLQRSGSNRARSYIFERDAGAIGSESNTSSPTVGTQKVIMRRVLERNERPESSTKIGPSLHEILKNPTSKVSAASIDCSEEIKAFYDSLAVSRYGGKKTTIASMR